MNKLVVLLILAVALALAKVVLLGLVIALFLALSYALITRPRELFLFLGAVTLLGLAGAHPLACIMTLGVVATLSAVANAKPEARTQAPLTYGREHRSK